MKEIAVSLENWRKILKLKKELGFKHNNNVISYFFRLSSIDKKTCKINDNIKKQIKSYNFYK